MNTNFSMDDQSLREPLLVLARVVNHLNVDRQGGLVVGVTETRQVYSTRDLAFTITPKARCVEFRQRICVE